MIAGRPIFFNAFLAFFIEVIISDFGKSILISLIHFLNFFLSSAFEIALEFAPINSTLYFLSSPFFFNCMVIFKAVWPPIVDNIAQGFSFLIMLSKIFVVMGSI